MPKVKLKKAELYYEIHGSGPTVVFIHGLTGNHLSWWQQIPEFSRSFKCIIYDQRCFGLSDVATPENADSFVEDLYELLVHLTERDIRLVCQSWGGTIGMRFAIKYPNTVKALVIAASDGGLIDKEKSDKLVGTIPSDPKNPLSSFYSAKLLRNSPKEAFLFAGINGMNPPRPSDFFQRVRTEPPSKVLLSKLAFPTLFVSGEDDVRTPPALMNATQTLVPHSRITHISGAGHSAFFEQPHVFNHEVTSFLERPR